jgi:DNA mismatch repair protein MutS2
MIYPDSLEQKLGFDQIRSRLRSYCLSASGADHVDAMQFSGDPDLIRRLLRQTLEFRFILEKNENFPSRHYYDAGEWLQKIALQGNYIEAEEFLKLAQALDTVIGIKNFC